MPLTPQDEKLFHHLASNPKSREKLLKEAESTGFKEHPAIQGRLEIESVIEPFREEIKGLKEKLIQKEQNDTWAQQRNSLRSGPFRFDDDKIKRLEERMRDPDAPSFPQVDSHGITAYQNAAKYFANLDSPLTPNAPPVALDMGGMPVGGSDAEPWRKELESTDKNVNPLMMNRKQRKLKARRAWADASKEYMEKLAGNTGRF